MKVPESLIQNYLDRRVAEYKTLEKALKSSDFGELFKIGHQLKGNGLMFGFPAISDIGAHIETSSLTRNISEIEIFLAQYRSILESIVKKQLPNATF